MISRLAPIFGMLLTFSMCASFANADVIVLENGGAALTTGDLLDDIGAAEIGTMSATVSVVEIPGLTLTVTGINSDAPTTSPVLNSLIENGDLSNGTTDVFDFATPLEILANTSFTLEATAGSIGIEGIHVRRRR